MIDKAKLEALIEARMRAKQEAAHRYYSHEVSKQYEYGADCLSSLLTAIRSGDVDIDQSEDYKRGYYRGITDYNLTGVNSITGKEFNR